MLYLSPFVPEEAIALETLSVDLEWITPADR